MKYLLNKYHTSGKTKNILVKEKYFYDSKRFKCGEDTVQLALVEN